MDAAEILRQEQFAQDRVADSVLVENIDPEYFREIQKSYEFVSFNLNIRIVDYKIDKKGVSVISKLIEEQKINVKTNPGLVINHLIQFFSRTIEDIEDRFVIMQTEMKKSVRLSDDHYIEFFCLSMILIRKYQYMAAHIDIEKAQKKRASRGMRQAAAATVKYFGDVVPFLKIPIKTFNLIKDLIHIKNISTLKLPPKLGGGSIKLSKRKTSKRKTSKKKRPKKTSKRKKPRKTSKRNTSKKKRPKKHQ